MNDDEYRAKVKAAAAAIKLTPRQITKLTSIFSYTPPTPRNHRKATHP